VSRAARLALVTYGIAAAVYALDRVTKAWAEASLATRPPLQIVPGVLQLNYTTNSGGAFSIGQRAPWVFVLASVAVIAFVVGASLRLSRLGVAVGLGLVLGGALGNLTDRIARGPGLSGRVVDFIDLHVWPVFNGADAAIVLGAVVLVAGALRRDGSSDPTGSSDGGGPREPRDAAR
jgi:signal peptidase II